MEQTPQEQADAFVKANDKRPVVAQSGTVSEPGKPRGDGARYQLEGGKWYQLDKDALALLPAGYPRWEQA